MKMRIERILIALGLVLAVSVGPALAKPWDETQDPSQGLDKPEKHKFTVAQAKSIALDAVSGKIVGEPTFKHDGGYWSYVVTIKGDRGTQRVWVDSDTGHIVGIDTLKSNKGKDPNAVKNLKSKVQQAVKKGKKAKKPKKKTTYGGTPVIIVR